MTVCDLEVLNPFLKQNDIHFLRDLPNKQNQVSKEIELANSKKAEIIEKILENANTSKKKPTQIQKHLDNSEASFENIEKILKNLNELQNKYNDLEKDIIFMIEKYNFSIEIENLEEYLDTLATKIYLAQTYETSSKSENEKYITSINRFLKKQTTKNTSDHSKLTKFGDLQDHLILRISEKEKCVELPYTKNDIEKFLNTYPNHYKTVQDVISKEYTMHISLYNNHPALARFREAYYLCRNKEMMPIIDSFLFAKSMMFQREINPTIIAAVKSQKQLEDYITCLKNNTLDEFKHFEIIFEVNPT